MSEADVIDTLAGLAPDSPVAQIRDRKPITREHAQASYLAVFEPGEPGDVTAQERFALATFVAGLHEQNEIALFYAAGLARTAPSAAFTAALLAEIGRGGGSGPYGAYPKGPLSVEDVPGPIYAVAENDVLGARMAAALAHVHMLVFHPRDANPAALQTLLDAGWSNAGIVTLSQLVAFLSFQIRAAAGLRTLAAAPAPPGQNP
jgi:CMD domain protein